MPDRRKNKPDVGDIVYITPDGWKNKPNVGDVYITPDGWKNEPNLDFKLYGHNCDLLGR